MNKAKKSAKSSGKAKVRDLKPRKDAKGGLLPAVGPAARKSLNFTKSN